MKVASKEMLTAIAQHKERRRKETQKVNPALEFDGGADDDCDPPEDYRDYGDPKQDFADAVGISRHRTL